MLFKKRTKTSIRVVDRWEKTKEKYAPGVLIEVTNGKGLLKEKMIYSDKASHLVLMLGKQPLIQLQSDDDEYFCPTCEKILKSAYSLEHSEQFLREMRVLNQTEDFHKVVESIKPFLELLEEGNYILLDTKLYPTDGNGHLFWNVPNLNCRMSGTCCYYYSNGEWGNNRPYFTVATQPYGKLDNSRVDYYMKNPQGRVLAYHMDGYMTALIDGHHKAMAAAKLHKLVDALVIIPCYVSRRYNEDNTWTEYVGNGEFFWNCSEYGLRHKSTGSLDTESYDGKDILSFFINNFPENVNHEMCRLAAFYPDVHGVARIDLIGEITQQRLDNIINHKEIVTPNHVLYFLEALVALKHSRTIEIFEFFMHEDTYFQEKYALVKEIIKLNTDGKLTDYLINVLVEFEDDYPEIKDLILDYI